MIWDNLNDTVHVHQPTFIGIHLAILGFRGIAQLAPPLDGSVTFYERFVARGIYC